MKIFKYKHFAKWAKKYNLTDQSLKEIVTELEQGLLGASLGNKLYKMRVAGKGRGKRGGFRILMAFESHHRALFMFGFSKNEVDTLSPRELQLYQLLAKYYLAASQDELLRLITKGELIEVQ
ncbi:MAG: type II toxin-antitoxin system RelE/ParE family toxin [Legionellales bacterium]|nr:type II toxin-antitoxin system RelE/ParE family toxin [Legionellales bacterium]